MKWHVGKLAVALFLVTVLLVGAVDVWAQAKGGSFNEQILGSWVLVSNVNEQDGKKSDVFGPNPRGFMTLTPSGHFTMIMMNASLPKFASNNRVKGTAEENQAVVQGSVAMFGTYKVIDEKEYKVMLHYDGSTFPNWDGRDLPRIMTVNGDEMKMVNPAAQIGGTNYVIWKRVK